MNNSEENEDHGLPDIEYKPLDDRTPVYEDDEEESNPARIIGWVVVLVVLIGAFLMYRFVYLPKKEKQQNNVIVRTDENQGEVGVVRSNELELVATSPEGCKIYSLRNHLITICPDGYKASEVK